MYIHDKCFLEMRSCENDVNFLVNLQWDCLMSLHSSISLSKTGFLLSPHGSLCNCKIRRLMHKIGGFIQFQKGTVDVAGINQRIIYTKIVSEHR